MSSRPVDSSLTRESQTDAFSLFSLLRAANKQSNGLEVDQQQWKDGWRGQQGIGPEEAWLEIKWIKWLSNQIKIEIEATRLETTAEMQNYCKETANFTDADHISPTHFSIKHHLYWLVEISTFCTQHFLLFHIKSFLNRAFIVKHLLGTDCMNLFTEFTLLVETQ